MKHTFTVIIEIDGIRKQYTVTDTVDNLLYRLTKYLNQLKQTT